MTGTWVAMLLTNLLIPATMLGFGRYFSRRAPAQINNVFGYRTTRSMKNRDTWQFAHRYCGKLWQGLGLVLLVVTVVAMLPALGWETDALGYWGMALVGIQTVVLVGSIFPVEAALKRTFDDAGRRKVR